MKPFRIALLSAALAALGTGAIIVTPARAQSREAELLARARAYMEELRNDDSVSMLLQEVLRAESRVSIVERLRAWTLFGITSLVKGEVTAARLAFRQALQIDPTLEVDSLRDLHTDLIREFSAERASLGTVQPAPIRYDVLLAADTIVPATDGRLVVGIRPVRRARVVATITALSQGRTVIWSDSLMVSGEAGFNWSLRDKGDSVVPSGGYELRITASDSTGQAVASRVFSLGIARAAVDTTPFPSPLSRADFVDEMVRVRHGPATTLLVGALFAGAAVAMPSLVGNAGLRPAIAADSRIYAVAGAASLATLYGYLRGSHWTRDPERVRRNQDTRETRRRRRGEIADANNRARASAPLLVSAQELSP